MMFPQVKMAPLLFLLLFAPLVQAYSTVSYPDALKDLYSYRSSQGYHQVKLIHPKLTAKFYKKRDHKMVWSRGHEISFANMKRVLNFMEGLSEHGIQLKQYQLNLVEQILNQTNDRNRTVKQVQILDVIFTDRVLAVIQDLVWGQVNPRRVHKDWDYRPNRASSAEILNLLLDRRSLHNELKDLLRHDKEYSALLKMKDEYETIVKKGGWSSLPRHKFPWEQGSQGSHIQALAKRLQASDDLKFYNTTAQQILDEKLVDALKSFQKRHGLNADGVVGHETWKALNVSAEKRLQQIVLNLERLRWYPYNLGAEYIWVNIPDYTVQYIHNNKSVFESRTVVGNVKWKTPVFKDNMEYVVFNPNWNVPSKIAEKETIPYILEEKNYLKRNNFKVYKWKGNKREAVEDPSNIDWSQVNAEEYLFVQQSGKGNSLGKIKFLFPNRHAVYLHDTPSKYLFKRDRRAYSHGCIRVADPIDFSKLLLKKDKKNWTEEKIKEALSEDDEVYVKIDADLPIYITYFTAWVGEDGSMQFRDDIYGYDQELKRALDRL